MIPYTPAPNPANTLKLSDVYHPITPERLINLQGAATRNRLAAIQMQDEMDYRNALLQGNNSLQGTPAPTAPANSLAGDPAASQEVQPTGGQVNALAPPQQPGTYGAYKAQQELAAQRVTQMDQYSKGIANLKRLYGPRWKEAYKQMEPDIVATFPMARNVNIDQFMDGDNGVTAYPITVNGRPTGKMAIIDAEGKTHIADVEPKASEPKTDYAGFRAAMKEQNPNVTEKEISDTWQKRRIEEAGAKREGTERLAQGRAASDLRKQFYGNPVVKDYNDVAGKYKIMEQALTESRTSKNLAAVDQALITLFNKMTDPQSVVRESEYARTPGDLALMNRIKGKAEKIMKGGAGLTADDRNALVTMGKKFYGVYQSRYLEKEDEYRGYAELQGVNPDLVIRPLSKTKGGPAPAAERNNNPLNLKMGSGTQNFVDQGIASEGSEAKDGGRFLKFNDPEAGLNAAKEWLFTGKPYQGLTVHQAMLKWSNKGYGGNIVPQIADKKLAALTEPERNQLIQAMARAEGSGSMVANAGTTATDATTAPGGKPLTKDLAAKFYKEAGNNRQKAEQIARARGYTF